MLKQWYDKTSRFGFGDSSNKEHALKFKKYEEYFNTILEKDVGIDSKDMNMINTFILSIILSSDQIMFFNIKKDVLSHSLYKLITKLNLKEDYLIFLVRNITFFQLKFRDSREAIEISRLVAEELIEHYPVLQDEKEIMNNLLKLKLIEI